MTNPESIFDDLGTKKKSTSEQFAEMISKMFTLCLIVAFSALGVWGLWNWLAWNVFNAPQMSYWVACAAIIAIDWFFDLFKKEK